MNKVYADFIQYPGVDGLKDCYQVEEALGADELQLIRGYFDSIEMTSAATRSEGGVRRQDNSYRTSHTGWIPRQDPYRWIYQRLGELVNEANAAYWHFDLTGMIEPIQLTEYSAEQSGHYDWHTDVGGGRASMRKISISLQISDASEYEGGELQFMTRRKPQNAKQSAGTAVLFPSYILHRVRPVTRGIRRSIVVWVSGPPYR